MPKTYLLCHFDFFSLFLFAIPFRWVVVFLWTDLQALIDSIHRSTTNQFNTSFAWFILFTLKFSCLNIFRSLFLFFFNQRKSRVVLSKKPKVKSNILSLLEKLLRFTLEFRSICSRKGKAWFLLLVAQTCMMHVYGTSHQIFQFGMNGAIWTRYMNWNV